VKVNKKRRTELSSEAKETMRQMAELRSAAMRELGQMRKHLAGGRKLTCDCEKPDCETCNMRKWKRLSRERIKRRLERAAPKKAKS
jgi:adenine-specific DNA glycosylase